MKKRYERESKELENIRKREREEMEKEIKELENTNWVEYSKEEIDEEINVNKECLKDMRTYERLSKEWCNIDDLNMDLIVKNIKKLEIKIEKKKRLYEVLKLQQGVFECPTCTEKLCFNDNKLEIYEGINELKDGDIEEVKKSIIINEKKLKKNNLKLSEIENNKKRSDFLKNELENIKNKYDEIYTCSEVNQDIESLVEYKRENKNIEKRLKKLRENFDNKIFSSTYLARSNSVEKLKKIIDEESSKINNVEEKETEEELREEIKENEKIKMDLYHLNINITKNKQNVDWLYEKIEKNNKDFSEKYENIREIKELDFLIKTEEDTIDNLEKKLLKHQENLIKINKYLNSKKEYEKYLELENNVLEYNRKEKESRDKYSSSQKLLSYVLEAESKSIGRIIDNINCHVEFFLEKFFVEEPISIKLKPYKQNKKVKKPQINLDIEYKGMNCDINMLSGGEKSRVILAFTLALGEMFNIPFLMLDESTASLDQDLTTIVFNGIKDNFENKLVIIIAHQIITGVFDKIINL